MQGSIAQTLSIVMTGNAFLQGRDIGRWWPEASVFQFCRTVEFVAAKKGLFGQSMKVVAADPMTWLRDLGPSTRGLRVHALAQNDPRLSDRMSVGFVGGGRRWLIEAVGERPSLWQDAWRVGNKDAVDRRIWDVAYLRLTDDWREAPPAIPSVAEARAEFAAALEAIAAFAARLPNNVDGFRGMFANGLAILREGSGEGVYHRDLAPPGFLHPDAEALIDAVQASWVFGGMGSWNDGAYWGDDEKEGDAVSDRLFDAMQQALAAAANSTFALK